MLLGLAAMLSHTAVVWGIALIGQALGRRYAGEALEPFLQLASAAVILGVAAWMVSATWRERRHGHDHHRHDHDGTKRAAMRAEVFV